MSNDAISACRIFSGMSEEQLAHALEFFRARRQSFRRGDFLHRPGEPLVRFGLVLSGGVQVCMDDLDGQQMIMANVAPGETFGEALAFLRREAHIYITAVSDSEVMWLDPDAVRSAPPADSELTERFIAAFAERTLRMNDRIQLLSKLTLRARLTTFFSQQIAAQGAYSFTVPFSRAQLAAYLGADRSALSRELGRMKADGIIDFEGNKFTVKK